MLLTYLLNDATISTLLSTEAAGLVRGEMGSRCAQLLPVKRLASGKSALKRTVLETRRAMSALTLRTE